VKNIGSKCFFLFYQATHIRIWLFRKMNDCISEAMVKLMPCDKFRGPLSQCIAKKGQSGCKESMHEYEECVAKELVGKTE
jgi:hypothetical protein